MSDAPVLYRRVLLKLSGEALMGNLDYGIEPAVIQRIATEVSAVHDLGIEVMASEMEDCRGYGWEDMSEGRQLAG